MRWKSAVLLVGGALAAAADPVGAQQIATGPGALPNTGAVAVSPGPAPANLGSPYTWAFAPPGNYGVAYGYASFGVPRMYSAYSSSYGPGYAYGYAPYAILPGSHGVGLWRSDAPTTANTGGAYLYYRTFAVTPQAADGPLPPLGWYAPGYGPPSYPEW